MGSQHPRKSPIYPSNNQFGRDFSIITKFSYVNENLIFINRQLSLCGTMGSIFENPGELEDDMVLPAAAELDKIDLGILNILRRAARTPNSHMAKELGISEPTVRRRIARLQDLGIIRGFTALVDYTKMGRFIKGYILMDVDKGKMNAVYEELSSICPLHVAHRTMGKHNLVCEVLCHNHKEIQNYQDQIRNIDGCLSVEFYLVMDSLKACPWSGI